MCAEEVTRDIDIQIAVFNELSAAMRHQSQAEYVYTASAVAGYGGICLGVASLPTTVPVAWVSGTAAVFILGLSWAIYKAISHNCGIYKAIQVSRTEVVGALKAAVKDGAFIPAVWTETPNPIGVKRAYAILLISTAGAVAFCAVRAIVPA